MIIRTAKISDLDAIKVLEDTSFDENERVSRKTFGEFLRAFGEQIWLTCEMGCDTGRGAHNTHDGSDTTCVCGQRDKNDELVVAQIVTQSSHERDLDDEMYMSAKFHDTNGAWIMVVSLAVAHKFQRCGYAKALMDTVKDYARTHGKKGIVLTCNAGLVKFYEKLGFANEGVSKSKFGGASWHQMRYEI